MKYISILASTLSLLFSSYSLLREFFFYNLSSGFITSTRIFMMPTMVVDGVFVLLAIWILIYLLRTSNDLISKWKIWIGILLLPISTGIHYGLSSLILNIYKMNPIL